MKQQQYLSSSTGAPTTKAPWWDLFRRCREMEEHDDYYHPNGIANNIDDCFGTAVNGVRSILSIILPLSSNGGSDEEEQQQQEVVTLHPAGSSARVRNNDSEGVVDNVRPGTKEGGEDMSIYKEALATSLNVASSRTIRDDVDAALSCFVLSRILGSPTSSIVKDGKNRDVTIFLEPDEGNIRGHFDFDDIHEEEEDSIVELKVKNEVDLNDTCTTSSLVSDDDADESDDVFSIPDIEDTELQLSHQYSSQVAATSNSGAKDLTNSILAFSALSMILNAPAPSALAVNKSAARCTNFFDDDEATAELDDVFGLLNDDEEQESVDDDDIFQIWLQQKQASVLLI